MKSKERLHCLLFALLLVSNRAIAQQWDWVQRFAGDRSSGTSIALDGIGNIYVAGTFSGTNRFGTNTFVSAGSNDVFIAKLNTTGEVLWAVATGGSGDDWIRLVVSAGGAVFVSGHFSIQSTLLPAAPVAEARIENVLVARVDEGKFTWFDTNGSGGGIAFDADQSLWVLGVDERAFLKHYTPDGMRLGELTVGEGRFAPTALAINRDGQFFLTGIADPSTRIGTNVIQNRSHFLAALDPRGQLLWARDNGRWDNYLIYPIHGIATTPDGGLIYVGYRGTTLPDYWAYFVKRSPDGAVIWQSGRGGGCIKNFWSANAVAVDPRGNVLVAGNAYICPYYDTHSKLWVATLDSSGKQLNEQFVQSYGRHTANVGFAVTGNDDGDLFVAGQLMDRPTFGTNRTGVAGAGPNAFFARRPTLRPELTAEIAGTNFILSWPRTALPFALQQSDGSGTNWMDVPEMPEEIVGHKQVILPAAAATGLFRLVQTNEAPIRHVPRWMALYYSTTKFLDWTNVIVARPDQTTPVVLEAYVEDLDDDKLTFAWFDRETGLVFTNGLSATRQPGQDDQWSQHPPYYVGALRDDKLKLTPGLHTITAVASDGAFQATNSISFEVISFETAFQDLLTRLEHLVNDPRERKLLVFVQAALRVGEQGRTHRAEKYWRRFQRQLQHSESLTAEERARLSSAGSQIQTILRTD